MHLKGILLLRALQLQGAILLAVILPAGQGLAATYYVDQSHPNASDSNAGTSETTPWRTLVRAMTAAAGDTVYVKSGTYTESNTIMFGTMPALQPATGGQPGNPIAFRVFPGNAVTLGVSLNNSAGNNYIIWDGFTMAQGQMMRFYGDIQNPITGVIVENCTAQIGGIPEMVGNYVNIFLQHVANSSIRNCIIRNAYYTNSDFENASGITMYYTNGVIIEHNEFYNNNTAIFDKSHGQNNVFRYNFIHDIYAVAIKIAGFGCDAPEVCGGQRIYQNVIYNTTSRPNNAPINIGSASPFLFYDVQVWNNTFYNVAYGVGAGTTPGLRMWNNVMYVQPGNGYVGVRTVSSYVSLSNFNDFYNGGSWRVDQYQPTEAIYFSLPSWQAGTGLDLNSMNQDPRFVGPLTGTPPATAFRLQPTSPLINAGRVSGVASGAPVNMGAYISDTDVIGRVTDTVAPAPPTGLQVS